MSRLILFLIILSALAACTPAQKQAAPETMTELPFPSVPDSITTPEERAAFVARHFWDGLVFGDSLSLDTAFMEQNFANFLPVADLCRPDDLLNAFTAVNHRAIAAPAAFDLLDYVAEKYLNNPNSPMRSEAAYELYLRSLSAAGADSMRLEAAADRLERIAMNRPGTRAADFPLEFTDGRRSTLLRSLGDGRTLVMFYDPDCENCRKIRESMAEMTFPSDICILAVAVGADRNEWLADTVSTPSSWTVALAAVPIEEDNLYDFRAMPTFYLLDSVGTVLAKDISFK